MAKYRKKPVVVEAVQFDGQNIKDIEALSDSRKCEWEETHPYGYRSGNLSIRTLEGVMLAKPGDFIIKGVNGEIYPCKPDIFEKTYEPVED